MHIQDKQFFEKLRSVHKIKHVLVVATIIFRKGLLMTS